MTASQEFEHEITRTLAIVKQLAEGKRLTLPDGHIILMGEDMSIGFLWVDAEGVERVAGLATLDLCGLNRLLNEHEINMPIYRKE